MPRFETIKKVLVIGSGGIVIAQAAEFDYSGSQALKALKEEGIETVLVNPNVATIQTSLRMADKVYLEPITVESVAQIIRREKPDGILLGFGGQTALNVGVQLAKRGVLKKEGVKILGSSIETIEKTEDRDLFRKAMEEAKVPVPKSEAAYSVDDALKIADKIGYPVIVRVAYTLGGGGSGVAYNSRQLKEIVDKALPQSLAHQVLIEQYLEHWKEVEYEVMRDYADNTITVCALENVDPLGIHTGDSIVVAPTQTLTNREYQMLRSAAIRVIRTLKVVGECNIQFGLNPQGEDYVAIEVNARMSRSSALASKATGYPLAYIAAKLAIGYTLPELINKVTGITTACFEPALDYVVVKIPRWDFDKFPGPVDRRLGPQMKSVGEVMSIARSFEEALQKAIRGLDIGKLGLVCNDDDDNIDLNELRDKLRHPTDQRIFHIAKAIEYNVPIDEINKLTGIDRWFLYKIKNIVDMKRRLEALSSKDLDEETLKEYIHEAKKLGFSDAQIARCLKTDEDTIRAFRKKHNILPCFKMVDTMAAEWPAKTNYCYVTYGDSHHDVKFDYMKRKVLILGAGCIRIGSSVEFDYCTMNMAWALKEEGVDEVIIVNNNPETVSTDYDMSDKLYFEEITLERILDIIDMEKPFGVVVSVGGQTPNNLALPLAKRGARLLGSSAESIDMAENRAKFSSILDKLKIPQPVWKSLTSIDDIKRFAAEIGYPVIIRPSYVLSGAAMHVAYSEEELENYIKVAAKVSREHPVVVSKFIENAKEVEVDAVSDGEDVIIGAVIEHIEFAGTHSGDATMVIPPQTLSEKVLRTIENYVHKLANTLKIKGPFNVQFLVKDETVYVIELNLRASRSFPFTSKASGIPLMYLAAKVILGKSLKDLQVKKSSMLHVAVKSPTFSFIKLKGADPVLGVEMTSTGEVACMDYDFSSSFIKALTAAGYKVPNSGDSILLSVRAEDKNRAYELAKIMRELNYKIYSTSGTGKFLRESGIDDIEIVGKISEGSKDIISLLINRKIGLVINVPSLSTRGSVDDNYIIRRTAVEFSIPVLTRIETALALVKALKERGNTYFSSKSLNELLINSPFSKYI